MRRPQETAKPQPHILAAAQAAILQAHNRASQGSGAQRDEAQRQQVAAERVLDLMEGPPPSRASNYSDRSSSRVSGAPPHGVPNGPGPGPTASSPRPPSTGSIGRASAASQSETPTSRVLPAAGVHQVVDATALVLALSTSHGDALTRAVQVVSTVATDPEQSEGTQRLGAAGAVSALLTALSGSGSSPSDVATWVPCCTALAALLEALPQRAGEACEQLPFLVAVLSTSGPPPQCQAAAASVLCAACSAAGSPGAACRDVAQRCAAVPVLSSVLQSARVNSAVDPAAALALSSAAAAALCACITEHAGNATALVGHPRAIEALVALLDVTSDDEAPFYAAAAFRALVAAGPPAAQCAQTAGAHDRLGRLAGDGAAHLLVRLEAIKALAAHAACVSASPQTAAQAAVLASALRPDTLASLLRAPAAHQFWREAVLAAASLLTHAHASSWAGHEDTAMCVGALAQLLASALDEGDTTAVDVDLATAALLALASPAGLLSDAHCAEQLDTAPGALDAALTLMQLPPPSPAPAAACTLLAARLSHGTPPSSDLLAAAAPLLASLLRPQHAAGGGSRHLVVCAARAIAAMAAASSDGAEVLCRCGAIAKLVPLCAISVGDSTDTCSEAAAMAVHQLLLSGGGRCRRAVCAAAGASALVALCAQAPKSAAAAHAACALAVLASDDEGLDALDAAAGADALHAVIAATHEQDAGHGAAVACLSALGRGVHPHSRTPSSSSPGSAASPHAAQAAGALPLGVLQPRGSSNNLSGRRSVTNGAHAAPLSTATLVARIQAIQLGTPLLESAALSQDMADATLREAHALVAADAAARQRAIEEAQASLAEAEYVHAEAAALEAEHAQQAAQADAAAAVAADIESRAWMGVADAESALSATVAQGAGVNSAARAIASARLAAANAKANAAQAAAAAAAQRAAQHRELLAQTRAALEDASQVVTALAASMPRRAAAQRERVYHRKLPGLAGTSYNRVNTPAPGMLGADHYS